MAIIQSNHYPTLIDHLMNHIDTNQITYIISEDVTYLEDQFLNNHPYLFNVEIMNFHKLIDKLIMDNHLFSRSIFTKQELVYAIRHILNSHDFTLFSKENPYTLIDEIIQSLKLMHANLITNKPANNPLSKLKFDELFIIDNYLKENYPNKYLLEEELVLDSLDTNENYIFFVDAYTDKIKLHIINKLQSSIYLFSSNQSTIHNYLSKLYQAEQIIHIDSKLYDHLFDQEKITPYLHASKMVSTHILQECMKVLSDIKEKIVSSHAYYHDFTLIVQSASYYPYLSRLANQLDLPLSINKDNSFEFDASYKLIHKHIKQDTLSFKNHVAYLKNIGIDSNYQAILDHLQYEDEISGNEFLLFLDAILTNKTEKPTRKDTIQIVTIDEAMNHLSKYVYVLNINEDVLPARIEYPGIFNEEDFDLENAPLPLSYYLGSHYLQILKLLMNDSIQFTFSYSKSDMSDSDMIPSTLFLRLEQFYHLKESKPTLELFDSIYYLHQGEKEYSINQLINKYHSSHNQPEPIDSSLRQFLGEKMSISRIETYNKCPYQYYIKYGLKIYNKPDNVLLPTELGSLAHFILENGLDNEDLDNKIQAYISENLKEKYEQSLINHYFIHELIKNMKTHIQVIRHMFDHDSFSIDSKEKKVEGKFANINFQGFIDRIDHFEDYFRIIDYKSSDKSLQLSYAMQGFNIQMLVYLYLYQKQTGKLPGGVLYYTYKKKVISKNASKKLEFNDTLSEEAISKLFKMNGYMIDEADKNYPVFHASDNLSIPMDLKKNNTPFANSKLLSNKELDTLMKHIESYISDLYKQLIDGKIPIHPSISDNGKELDPCTFCDYKSVCLYDMFINEHRVIQSDLYKKGEK